MNCTCMHYRKCFIYRCEETDCTTDAMPVPTIVIIASLLVPLVFIIMMVGIHYGPCCCKGPADYIDSDTDS